MRITSALWLRSRPEQPVREPRRPPSKLERHFRTPRWLKSNSRSISERQATPKHARAAYSEWPGSSKASLSGNFEDRGDSEGGSNATFERSGRGRINKTSPRHGELALYIYFPKILKTLGRHFGLGPRAGPMAPMRIDYVNLSLSLSPCLYIYVYM